MIHTTAIIFLIIQTCMSANILFLTVQFPSLLYQHSLLAGELSRRGHNVYLVVDSQNEAKQKFGIKGIEMLTFNLPKEEHSATSDTFAKTFIDQLKFHPGADNDAAMFAWDIERDIKLMLLDNNLISHLRTLHLDLVVVDYAPFVASIYLFPYILGVPHITVTALPFLSQAFQQTRVPLTPAFIPTMLSQFSQTMTFGERVTNLLQTVITTWMICEPPGAKSKDIIDIHNKYAPEKSSNDLISESRLFIQYTDHILDGPSPSLPPFIRTPGISLTHPKPITDAKLLGALDSAIDDVIIMSFGSFYGHLPPHILDKFIDTFSRINQTVVWKVEHTVYMQNSPLSPNVIIVSWMPQFDLLAHPKVKLFITHCGNNGQYEAVYNGVPMVGFPIVLDQFYNCARVTNLGYGVQMNLETFTPEDLVSNITHIQNSRNGYAARVTKAAAILHDAPELPRETAARWIEHVLDFGDSDLRTAAYGLTLWQYYLLDVLICGLVSCTAVCVFILFCCIRQLYFKFC